MDTTGAPPYSHDDWLTLGMAVVAAFVYVAMADDGTVSDKEVATFNAEIPKSVLMIIPEGRGALDAILESADAALRAVIEGARIASKGPLAVLMHASEILERAPIDNRWVFKRGLTDLAMATAAAGTPLGNAREEYLRSLPAEGIAMLQGGLTKQRAAQEIIDLLGVRPEVVRPAVDRVIERAQHDLSNAGGPS